MQRIVFFCTLFQVILQTFITSEKWNLGCRAKEFSCFETFLLHSHRPTLPLAEENLKVIESFCSFSICHRIRYIIICWYSKVSNFQYRGNSEIQWLPPARDVLIQHIHKAAYLSGYIWEIPYILARTEESPTDWTWSFTGNRVKCQWVLYDYCLITQNLNKTVFKKCICI